MTQDGRDDTVACDDGGDDHGMDDYTQAALLFDYGWDDDIDPKYHIDFAPLSKNRKFIQDMARTEPEGYTHFSETLEYACKMVEKYQGSGKEINIE